MSLKFKLTSVIFVMILAIIVILSVFTLARSNSLRTTAAQQYTEEMNKANSIEIVRPDRDKMLFTVICVAALFAAATVITFLFARSAAKPINDIIRDISEGEADFAMRINGYSRDEAYTPGEMLPSTQSATKTLVKNNASIMGLIESSEAELAGIQDAVADIRGIILSIDNVLQMFDTVDSDEDMAKQGKAIHRNA